MKFSSFLFPNITLFMKIVYITPFFLPIRGGVEEYVYQISKYLKENGYDVTVLTSDYAESKKIKKVEFIDGIKVIRHKIILSFGDFGKFWPSFIFSLIKEKPDLIHVHNYRHPHTLISLLICKIMKIPCIITTHSPFHPRKSLVQKLLISLFDSFLSISNKFYDKVILISTEEKKYFKKLNNSVVIPHGIPSYFFKKSKAKQKGNILLNIGRVHPSKGQKFFLNALTHIKLPYKAIIVGPIKDYAYFKKLKKIVRERKLNVSFLPSMEREKLVKIYDNSKIVVVTSPYEAFGIVILEAFARGKPVIAVDSDGPRYLIKNGENGFLVKYGDEKSLAKYIELLLKNKKLYRKISFNNRKKAKEFLWDKIVKKLIKVYEEVLSNYHSI